nr:uncharacterized protein LOC127347739 [Lolium perenne]
MGRTHTSCPDASSASTQPQVHEHAVPLQAEAGHEFLEKLVPQGQKNKAPVPDAGSSQAPPAKRFRTEVFARKEAGRRRYKGKTMSVSSGPALKLSKSANGTKPESSEGTARASTPPPQSSPGVPSPPKTSTVPLPEAPNVELSGAAPTPPPETVKITKFLKPEASKGKATASGTASPDPHQLTLHAGRAAVAAGEMATGLLGRITEFKREAIPEASIEALKIQLAALQGEKEQLIREHREALDAQETYSKELKDQLIQLGLKHNEAMKAAQVAAEAKLNEALEDANNSTVVLRAELEEGAKARKAAEDQAARLEGEQKEYDQLVMQTDALALRLFPDSQAYALKKVAERRIAQAYKNLDAPWDPYDHLVALSARVSHMRAVDRNLADIPEVAIQLFKVLWPEEEVPANLSLTSDRLKEEYNHLMKELEVEEAAEAESAPPKQVLATLAALDQRESEDEHTYSDPQPSHAGSPLSRERPYKEVLSPEELVEQAGMDSIAHSDILNKPITPEDAANAEALEAKRQEMLATTKKNRNHRSSNA